MFEEYGEYFSQPSEVDLIIDEAKEKLNALLTEEVKQTMEQASEAKRTLEQIQREIRKAEYKLGNLKLEHQREEEKWEKLDQYRMPRQYIKKLVEAVAGDFAPGDTVYAIKSKFTAIPCPLCQGRKKVECTVVDRPGSIMLTCPTCSGLGRKNELSEYVKECKVSQVRMKLCFDSDRVCYWDKECVFLDNQDYNTDIKNIFHTKEEAEKALAERMAKEETE